VLFSWSLGCGEVFGIWVGFAAGLVADVDIVDVVVLVVLVVVVVVVAVVVVVVVMVVAVVAVDVYVVAVVDVVVHFVCSPTFTRVPCQSKNALDDISKGSDSPVEGCLANYLKSRVVTRDCNLPPFSVSFSR